MRSVFADPKSDLVFKRVFGSEASKEVLIALLNDLLELPAERRVVDLEYVSPEQVPPIPLLKRSIVDVKCLDAAGTQYLVEMQLLNVEGFEKRLVYNACRAYTSQLRAGEAYPELNDVVAIAICDFELWPDGNRAVPVPMLSRYQMKEVHSGAEAFQHLRLVVLELPKYRGGSEPQTPAERWAYFFRSAPSFDVIPAALQRAPFPVALERARTSAFTEAELDFYEREMMAEQDMRGAFQLATRLVRVEAKAEGIAEGKVEGKAEGRVEGRAEGLAEGKAEGIAEGIARGKAEATQANILAVAAGLGVSVAPEELLALSRTTDEAQLAEILRVLLAERRLPLTDG